MILKNDLLNLQEDQFMFTCKLLYLLENTEILNEIGVSFKDYYITPDKLILIFRELDKERGEKLNEFISHEAFKMEIHSICELQSNKLIYELKT